MVQHARQRHVRDDLPSEREAGDGLLPRERDGGERGDDFDVHRLHRVFRHGHRTHRVVPDPPADPPSPFRALAALISPSRSRARAGDHCGSATARAGRRSDAGTASAATAAARTAEETRVLVEGLRHRQQEVT